MTHSATRMSPYRLFWRLTTGRFSKQDGFDEAKNRFKFAARGALTLPSTLRWLDTLARQEPLLEYLRTTPRLASKLHRPYLYRSLDSRGKVAALSAHYDHIVQCFSPAVRNVLLSPASLTLATLEGRDELRFRCTLTHNHTFTKEGELSLQFIDPQELVLATLTFTICRHAGQSAIVVGGLQGPAKEYKQQGNESIRIATKACHGLFPKRLVLEALVGVARHIGCRQILGVCKDAHIYSSWRYRRDFQADYDSFWESIGASKIDRNFFLVPFPIPRKAMEDIASKKRSEYTRRYTLLDSLEQQIQDCLQPG